MYIGNWGFTLEGEAVFPLGQDIPDDVSHEVCEILSEYDSESDEEIMTYFRELLSFQRAVFMLEIEAPIDVVHRLEYYLREKGYEVVSHVYFGLDIPDVFQEAKPGDADASTSVYVSLHRGFIDLADLAIAGIGGDALNGLMFGYSVSNIIGCMNQPDLSPEELREYWDSLPPQGH